MGKLGCLVSSGNENSLSRFSLLERGERVAPPRAKGEFSKDDEGCVE